MSDRQTETTRPDEKPRGFAPLPCLRCGVAGGVSLYLDYLDAENAFACSECGERFGAADVRAAMSQWAKVLAWISAASVLTEQS